MAKPLGQIVLTNNPYWGGFVVGGLTALMAATAALLLYFGVLSIGAMLAAGIPAVLASIVVEQRKLKAKAQQAA